jgi:CheY-like chemotaxis protein
MSGPKHTLLLVDDEPEILDGLRRTLRNEGYRLLTTTSPLEAIEILARGGVDLLLSDIDMPEMSGIDLVARVRRDHPDVVRLLLTGDASLESALTAINEGEVHRYLTKPWTKETLTATLRSALDRLEELRRAAAADARAGAHERLLAELEREHPGIRDAAFDGDAYVIDAARVRTLLGAAPSLRPARSADVIDSEVSSPWK